MNIVVGVICHFSEGKKQQQQQQQQQQQHNFRYSEEGREGGEERNGNDYTAQLGHGAGALHTRAKSRSVEEGRLFRCVAFGVEIGFGF